MTPPILHLLGVGNSESLVHWNTNLLLTSDNSHLLIDCGFSIKYALHDHGLDSSQVDAVYITHLHGDHVHGLERLGFESRYVHGNRIRLILEPSLEKPLWDHCLKGTMGHSSSGENRLTDFFDIEIVENNRFQFGHCSIETFATPHTDGKDSFGVLIDGRVAFTSDSNVMPRWTMNTPELILHDFTIQEGNPAHANHSTMLEAYPEHVRSRILLTHYDDEALPLQELLSEQFMGLAAQGSRIVLDEPLTILAAGPKRSGPASNTHLRPLS